MAANIRCIMRAKAPYGQGLTKMKVNLAPEQSSTPSLYPETNTVYLTRPTEGTGELMKLVGGTVAWNQLVQNPNFATTNSWSAYNSNNASLSIADNVATMTYLASGGGYNYGLRQLLSANSIVNHIYLISADINVPRSGKWGFDFAGLSTGERQKVISSTGVWDNISIVTKATSATNNFIIEPISSSVTVQVNDVFKVRNVKIIDLTAYLTPSIADYVYNLEQSQAGSGIAWLKSYDLIDDEYHAYSAPTLQSVEATAHVTVGFNQWDEEWRNGYYKSANGAFVSNANYLCSKNKIPVFPSATYYLKTNNIRFEVEAYASDDSYVGRLSDNVKDNTFTTTANTAFITFSSFSSGAITTYNNDMCLNLSNPDKNGTYKPYVKHTTPLANVTLRGMTELVNGTLKYNGDTYEWDGTVTRYYGTRAYQAGDESLTDAITDGTNTVYKLTNPTTESADPFTAVQTVEDGGTEEFVTTNGVPVGVVGRFANAVPMEGVDSFTVTANDGTVHTYPVTLSEEVYSGVVDMLTGEAVSDMASIAEYNGETINSPWISSLDVYSAGATPTNGAQVVYPITPEEVTATITGDPTELSNVVSVSSTEGTVDWSELSEIGIKCIMKRKNPFQ